MNYFPRQKTNAWDHPGLAWPGPDYIDISKRSGGWIYGSNKICRLIFDWWNYFIISSYRFSVPASIHWNINVSVSSSSRFSHLKQPSIIPRLSFRGNKQKHLQMEKVWKITQLSDCNYVFFRFPHSPGAEQSAQAPVGQHVQQSHFWNTTRSLHQHDQTRQTDPLKE